MGRTMGSDGIGTFSFIMPAEQNYHIVCAYLKSLNIHFCEKWVSESINNLKSANFGLSSNDLKKSVYEKWLSTNLRDLKVGSLPPNVTSFSKITLNGTYAVQVESMVNSARSSYSELQRITNPAKCDDIDNKSNEDADSKRCLTFLLCDGVQEIQGMEYQLIPNIRLNDPDFLPGFKMIIKGPVVCRKGMLLLKQENVRVYGGKVESLCETNNLIRLLERTLGCSENNEENKTHTQPVVTSSNNYTTSWNIQHDEIARNTELYNDETMELNELLSENDDILLSLTFESGFADNSRQEAQNEQHCFSAPKKPRTNNYQSTAMEENSKNQSLDCDTTIVDERYSRADDKWSSNTNNEATNEFLNYASTSNSKEIPPDSFVNDIIIGDDIVFESQYLQNKTSSQTPAKCIQMKISSYLTNSKKQPVEMFTQRVSSSCAHKQTVKKVTSHPFVYLKQILDIALEKPTIFTVKAIILTLKSKITIKNDEFSLKASISDGSSSIQVDFSSDVVEDIMEYSPCEVISLLNDRNRNSAVAGRVKEIFSAAQYKLLSMNCLMYIKFFSDGTTPLIVQLEEVQQEHVNALKARTC